MSIEDVWNGDGFVNGRKAHDIVSESTEGGLKPIVFTGTNWADAFRGLHEYIDQNLKHLSHDGVNVGSIAFETEDPTQ